MATYDANGHVTQAELAGATAHYTIDALGQVINRWENADSAGVSTTSSVQYY